MTSENLTLLVEAIPAQINVELIVILMAIGAIIKHSKKLEKVSNKLIPIILGVVSLAVCLVCLETYTIDTIIHAISAAFVNAAGAVYCHQNGKNIFASLKGTFDKINVSGGDSTN